MTTETRDSRRVVLNLIIFVVAINVVGWLAWAFTRRLGTPEAQGLGMLIWLISPFLTSVILRVTAKDWRDMGLKPIFKGNGKWYVFSMLFYPLTVAVVVFTGLLFGGISTAGFSTGMFLQAMAVAAIGTFVKNIFEEFAWRGYLTPKLNATGINTITGHLLVGFIWGTWHLPYYLGLLDIVQLNAYTQQRMTVFLSMAIAGMTAAGILFGEIRLITGSTWPTVIMHTVSNLVITTLIMQGFVRLNNQTEIALTPGMEGVVSILLVVIAGLWLYRQRTSANA